MRHCISLLGLLMLTYLSGFQANTIDFAQYWEDHVGQPLPPHWLVAKASPLSLQQATMYTEIIEKNELASNLHLFCKQANVACSTNSLVNKAMSYTSLPPIAKWNHVKEKYDEVPKEIPLSIASQGGLPYFRESMVKQGAHIIVPDLRDPISYKSFLPRSLMSKIPFSSTKIGELKKLFGVVDGSNMDKYIQESLKTCEESPVHGERRICVTSAEDLVDFVVEKLGHQIRVWGTERIEGSYKNVTIGTVKLIHGNISEPPVVCQSIPFLFQVYYCLVLQNIKVYAVDIHAQMKVNHAIMACHYDTSKWNPNNVAFRLLGFGPGLVEVCHWINENGLVWTKTLT